MKIKKYLCITGVIISVLSVGILLTLNGLSVGMQEKQILVSKMQAAQEEISKQTIRLAEAEREIAEYQAQISEYDAQLKQLGAKQTEIRSAVELKSGLYDISLSGMPINYDVENFRKAEKTYAQSNKLLGGFLGKWAENLMNNDETSNIASAEKLRLSLYEKMSDFLDDSYRELAAAKAAYDGSYVFYSELAQMEKEEDLLANADMLEGIDLGQICVKEQEDLLHTLGKYTFDLSIISMMYDNTLTENETAFLSGLQAELQSLQGILALYDSEGNIYGYTPEEKLSRYKTMMADYVKIVWELTSRNTDNGIIWGSTITDYGNSVNKGHLNKNQVVIMEQRIVNSTSVRIYYYDRQGNPIYADFDTFDLVILDGLAYEVALDVNNPRDHESLQSWVEEAIKVKDEYCDAYYGDGRY